MGRAEKVKVGFATERSSRVISEGHLIYLAGTTRDKSKYIISKNENMNNGKETQHQPNMNMDFPYLSSYVLTLYTS
jgi:hypothetical protein